MVKKTDVLLLGCGRTIPGLDLRPYDPGRRGAWYSLGFLLRAEAARQLDIGTGELTVGYSVRHLDGRTHVKVFLADALENGAGYCTRLGLPSELARLLDGTDRFGGELSKPPHDECDSSCPDCLRDFTNLVFHPLLDWRLGRDLLDLLLGRALDTDRGSKMSGCLLTRSPRTSSEKRCALTVVPGESGATVVSSSSATRSSLRRRWGTRRASS